MRGPYVERVDAQTAANGITEPPAGAVLSGVVIIRGTATHSTFLRYELAFNRGSDWIVFAEGEEPVVNGTLAVWDTRVGYPRSPIFPDGLYQLRLRIVRQDYNYEEYIVGNLTIANDEVTPTVTGTPTGSPTPDGTAVAEDTPTAEAPGDTAADDPTPLPSLTPFPSPTPEATPNVIVSGSDGQNTSGEGEEGNDGLLARLAAINTERFRRAFWRGAAFPFYAFAILALYLALRGVWRRLWRTVWTREKRRR